VLSKNLLVDGGAFQMQVNDLGKADMDGNQFLANAVGWTGASSAPNPVIWECELGTSASSKCGFGAIDKNFYFHTAPGTASDVSITWFTDPGNKAHFSSYGDYFTWVARGIDGSSHYGGGAELQVAADGQTTLGLKAGFVSNSGYGPAIGLAPGLAYYGTQIGSGAKAACLNARFSAAQPAPVTDAAVYDCLFLP